MLIIHVNWMLILYCFIGALGLITLKFLVNYFLLSKGGMRRTTTFQHRIPPERWSVSIEAVEESQPPQFDEALKFSKPVYRIEIDEPPPPYHLVIVNSK